MSATTSIQWTDRTWNPVRGCSVVSPGCVKCYAMKMAHRFSGQGKAYEGLTKQTSAGPQWTGKVTLVHSALLEPLSWKKPARVFVNSMSDLFHEAIPDAYILAAFVTMAKAHRHTFQILTKRPARMQVLLSKWEKDGLTLREGHGAILPNVWLGVSAEDQRRAEERIPLLRNTPAAVRFVSAEPLLGPIDLLQACYADFGIDVRMNTCARDMRVLDWVIVGGESGNSPRESQASWYRDLRDQCRDAGVAFFLKQLGARPVFSIGYVDLKDRKGGDMAEWPEDLRVREFPTATESR